MKADAKVTTEGLAELFWLHGETLACVDCGEPPCYHLPTGGIIVNEDDKVIAVMSKLYCYRCAELEVAKQKAEDVR